MPGSVGDMRPPNGPGAARGRQTASGGHDHDPTSGFELPRRHLPPQGGGRNRPRDFKGEQRRRETHESSTDIEARTENPHSQGVDVELTEADPCSSQRHAATRNARKGWRCANGASRGPATVGAGGKLRYLRRAQNKPRRDLTAAHNLPPPPAQLEPAVA